MKTVRTFIVYVSDHPGVLNRVSSLFRRRGYNIESLTVGHTHIPEVSRMTVVVDIDAQGAPLVQANLYKLAEVLHVQDVTSVPSFQRELAIAKVAVSATARGEIMQILDRFGARILEDTKESMVVEVTGSEEGIDDFIQALRPHGILELTRTGRIAMIRGLPAQRAAAADAPGLYNPKVREEASTL